MSVCQSQSKFRHSTRDKAHHAGRTRYRYGRTRYEHVSSSPLILFIHLHFAREGPGDGAHDGLVVKAVGLMSEL